MRKANTITLLFALALYWATFVLFLFPRELFPDVPNIFGKLGYDFVFIAISVMAAVFLTISRKSMAFLVAKQRRVLSVLFLMACAVVIVPMVFLASQKNPPQAFVWLYPIVFSLYAIALTMNLSAMISMYSAKQRTAIMSASLLLSLVIGTVIPALLDLFQLSQSDANYPMMILSGLVVLLFLENYGNENAQAGDGHNGDDVLLCSSENEEGVLGKAISPKSYLVVMGILVLYLLGSGMFLGLYLHSNGSLWTNGDWLRFLLGTVLYLGFALYAVFSKDPGREQYPMVIFVFICLAALYCAALFSPIWSAFCKEVILPTRPFAMVLLWEVVINWALLTQRKPAWATSAIALPAICISSGFLNIMIIIADKYYFPILLINAVLLFVSFIITILMVVWLFISQKDKARILIDSSVENDNEPLATTSHEIAKEYGLSNRETEVLYYIAEGNTQKKIADNMCVSINSVQTYAKNLYRKLGVHSKQELIDLVVEKKRR